VKRIIFTTCGTSLFTSNCWHGISNFSGIVELKGEEKYEYEKRYQRFIKANKNNLVNLFDENCWNDTSQITKLPAELSSLRTIQKFFEKGNIDLTTDDKIVLVYADNEDAEFCAEVIHNVLDKYKLFSNVQIEKWKINELDPKDSRKFEKALENLWNEIKDRMPFAKNTRYFLNLTGGYKALVILFACFGYLKGIKDTYIFYLNEKAGENMLVYGFDPEKTQNGINKLKIGYIESQTGKLISPSLTPQDFNK